MLKKAFYNVKIEKMKSESGFSFAIASQPFEIKTFTFHDQVNSG